MTVANALDRSSSGDNGLKLHHWVVLLTFSLSSFVMFEPAPFELAFLAVTVLVIHRHLDLTGRPANVQLICGIVLYPGLGAVSTIDAPAIPRAIIYHAITVYMFLILYIVALIFQSRDERLKDMVIFGYLIGLFIAAFLGILEFFSIIPTDGAFTKFERLKGTYKDPNVFGPAAGFGFLFLLFWRPSVGSETIWYRSMAVVIAAIIGFGVFLTYSRASQGQLFMATLLVSTLVFLVGNKMRVKPGQILIAVAGFMVAAFMVVFVAPLVIDLEFLASRLGFQWYDFDRFAIQALALEWAMGVPLGVGPGQSEIVFLKFASIQKTGATHNNYIRVLVENGWVAFVAYLFVVYAIWFAALDRLSKLAAVEQKGLLAQRSRNVLIICFVVLSIHLVMGIIIDTLHWRHFFILAGMTMGVAFDYWGPNQTPHSDFDLAKPETGAEAVVQPS